MSAYFELVRWRWIVGNCNLIKMIFGLKLYDKAWRSYAWSKLGWLFLQNPNLATFGFWWIVNNPWGIMINPWSNDGYNFKMLMLTKNLEVWLYANFQKWPTLKMHISLNFNPKRVFLDFLESLGCPLNKLFCFISIVSSMFI